METFEGLCAGFVVVFVYTFAVEVLSCCLGAFIIPKILKDEDEDDEEDEDVTEQS